MYASRQVVEQATEAARTRLHVLRGSGTMRTRRSVTKRDGRIRLVPDSAPTAATRKDESVVQRAHERLRLPSLDRWLIGRLW